MYAKLAKQRPDNGVNIMGGDFNDTLHAKHDRTNQRRAKALKAFGLQRLISTWRITDCLADDIASCEGRADILDFLARQHTYRYNLPNGDPASSRIDRWYISDSDANSIRTCSATSAFGWSDHGGVVIGIADRKHACNIKREKKLYPAMPHATADIEAMCRQLVSESTILKCRDGGEFKTRVCRNILSTATDSTRRLKESFKTKRRRLLSSLRREQAYRLQPSAASLSERFERLTIGNATHLDLLQQKLSMLQIRRQEAAKNASFRAFQSGSVEETKKFFARF